MLKPSCIVFPFSENVSFGARIVLGVLGTMPVDVLTMLRWRLPPMLITLVLVLKLGTDDIRPSSLDFCELFAGGAEASGALRRVPLKHSFFFEFMLFFILSSLGW